MGISTEELQELHQQVCAYKEMLVKRFGAPTDMPPQLHVTFANGRGFAGMPTERFWGMSESGSDVFTLVGAGIRQLWAANDRARIMRVQFIAEGFMKQADGAPRGPDRFEKLYRDGDPSITESIGTYVADNDGLNGADMSSINQPFTYTNRGVVRWGEPILATPDMQMEGNIMDMLRDLFADTERYYP